MTDILSLEPKRLWYYFNEICKIPHGSENEKNLVNFIKSFAEKNDLKYKVEDIGNVVVYKDGVGSGKSAKPVALQAHIDMVCVGDPKIKWDPMKDPITPRIAGDFVTANRTSLGADCGIGVAAMLALLEDKTTNLPPLEGVFTVMEEKGLDGAFALDPKLIKARVLINLDSEEEGLLFIGSAGGYGIEADMTVKREPIPAGYTGLKLSVSGLKGGHSGLVINEQRGNANKIIARILYRTHLKHPLLLSDIKGGEKHNVIPSDGYAVFAVKQGERAQVEELIKNLSAKIVKELSVIDPSLKIELVSATAKDSFGQDTSYKLISFLNCAPNGVITMNYNFKEFVQTSTNLAVVTTTADNVNIKSLSRSSSATEMEAISDEILARCELLGLKTNVFLYFPVWQPDANSPLLKTTRETYKELFEMDPKVVTVHAGLETGVIGEKIPGMDMISFGPDLHGAHSIVEKVGIKSVKKMWQLTLRTLENFTR